MRAVVNRPVEDVFAHIVELTNQPKWHPSIVGAERITEGPIRIGANWCERFHVMGMGVPFQTVLENTGYEIDSRVTSRGTSIGTIEPKVSIARSR